MAVPQPELSTLHRSTPATTLQIVLKVASRCNLNCSYCYVYHKGDLTWQRRPHFMADDLLQVTLERVKRWCHQQGQRRVSLLFHGGEPLLAGVERFDRWCRMIRSALSDIVDLTLIVQTNGTLIDEEWITTFRAHHVQVGISMDGPEAVHDRERVDHAGRGSYQRVAAAIAQMRAAAMPVSILCVLPFGADGAQLQRHFAALGANRVSYLLPDFTHDTIAEIRRRYGPTPCADLLIPAFDAWWQEGTLDLLVEPFVNMTRVILGGESALDMIGNRPFGFVFVESDGAIEGLDVLRVCGHGSAGTGLNVFQHDFHQIAELSQLHHQAIFTGMPLPQGCAGCAEATTCAGGYLPHRWSQVRGFDNPSVWCADLLRLFDHIRNRLGVTAEETSLRRQVLVEMVTNTLT